MLSGRNRQNSLARADDALYQAKREGCNCGEASANSRWLRAAHKTSGVVARPVVLSAVAIAWP